MQIIYTYQGKEKVFDTEKTEIILGRPKKGVAVDLDLTPDQKVSRPHARIWVEKGEYWIEDLKSTRGTQVNGEDVKGTGKRLLKTGDTLRMGETTLRVEIPGEPDATIPPEVPEAEPDVKIEGKLDANVPVAMPVEAVTVDAARRLALLCELPLQFGTETRLDLLLQMIVDRLIEVIPGAARGVLLLRDHDRDALLLKAYSSPGKPAVSKTLAHRAMAEGKGIIWRHSDEEKASDSIVQHHIETGMYAPLLWQGKVLGAVCVDNPQRDATFTEEDLRLLMAVAHYAAMAVANYQLQEDLWQKAKLMERLLTNFSPKIREKLLERARNGQLRPGGKKSEVTILYSDIRGFTRMSTNREADEVADLLSGYFSTQVEYLFKYDGTIDKFIGDAILAVFGSPESDPRQYEKAVRAAWEMQAAVRELNAARAKRGQITCDIGIGVHCGEVFHGFIGALERIEFTVIGEVVNRASRYCDGAGAGEVLISPEMYQRVWEMVEEEKKIIKTKHEGNLPAYRIIGLKT
ncbi:MAG: GAF domain-containing protein [Nitrospira sp.]|nr:GAF domain-containing protein [Nitrospira sp.]